ncbi:MAG: extracellular solute-binding protein [Thermomicrobiales bacterium]|nr:extracellular solute-binding protein [Thermomicrobiales bacterium]
MVQRREHRRAVLKFGIAAVAAGFATPSLAALAQSTPAAGASSGESLTLYSGQHESLANALAEGFEAATGVAVSVRAGSDSDLANQIIEEGDKTNADVFITEEPGPAATLDAQGLLAPIDATSLAKTDTRFNPDNGHWLAYAARSRVIFYNPESIAERDLPASILDLVDARWQGQFAYAPTGAFTGTVAYLINTLGADDTLAWLQGIQQNGENLLKNGAIRDAVEAGQIPFGLSNHYYWYILAKEKGGPDQLTSRVHYMQGQDPGGLVFASAAAIPAAAKHPDLAQQFVGWLADADGGQAIIAAQSPQFPLAPGVESSFGLPPLSELDPPIFDQGTLKDSDQAVALILEAGII